MKPFKNFSRKGSNYMLKFQCDEKQDTDCKASLCACDIEFVNTIRQFQHKFDKGQETVTEHHNK